MISNTYRISGSGYSGTATVNYFVSYDASKNQTTVTAYQCSLTYSGRSGYSTSSGTTITVTANDSKDKSSTTCNISGTTTGSSQTFTGSPSSTTITVKHSDGAGTKSITIGMSSTVWVWQSGSSSQINMTGSGSTQQTLITIYSLTINAGNHSNVSVSRTVSKYGNTGTLSSGASIYSDDVLQIEYSGSAGYNVTGQLNGKQIDSGYQHTVSANVTVSTVETVLSYLLSITGATGITMTVTRTSSPAQGAATGALSDGDVIYYNDVLKAEYELLEGYEGTVKLNGSSITSGTSYVVDDDVVISAIAAIIIVSETGFVYIDTGSAIEKFQMFIDTGSTLEKYQARIDNGTTLEKY